jgi:PHD/YefM family antitoxin component YafN of YafNO toxin-antitoxin module
LTKTVTITKNSRDRTAFISAEEYAPLKRRDRWVIAARELSERQTAAIRDAQVPHQYADLNREIEDWEQ